MVLTPNSIGRKPAIVVTAAFFLLGSLFMTFAGSLASMLVGRFLAGLAVGASGPCVSVYLSEIAHPARRGTLVTINEVRSSFTAWGVLLGPVTERFRSYSMVDR